MEIANASRASAPRNNLDLAIGAGIMFGRLGRTGPWRR